jgi:C_GCAxxG_C_C family probable redox protein
MRSPNAVAPSSARASRKLATSTLLRMGHCAPSVAQTGLTLAGQPRGDWLVRLAAGLPGGIGNTGGECGAVTAAILLLGLRHTGEVERGLPLVIEEGHAYCRRFAACNGSVLCSAILGRRRVPLPCIRAVRSAPELLADVAGAKAELPVAEREAYARLWAHLDARGLHCAHAVLRRLGDVFAVTPELLAAASGFVGGTVMQGLTCSALAAGVMAIGLAAGEIESRRARVLRMLLVMAVGGDALDDRLNRFNRSVKRGRALVRWFAREFASARCRDVTGCTFASTADVERYVRDGQAARCEEIARRVADEARAILEREHAARGTS